MKINVFLILCASLFLSVACSQKNKKSENNLKVKETATKEVVKKEDKGLSYGCLVGKDLRVVNVDEKPGRCEVFYTKFSSKGQVAWAEATPAICSRVFKQIRTNIESKGFKCDSNLENLKTSTSTAGL